MSPRSMHAAWRAAIIFFCLIASLGLVRAQNENETVGFRSNHVFDSGQFGENIDILNGALNLTVPIGPRYQVNANLGYQLNLSYHSKVWDTSDLGSGHVSRELQVLPNHESPVGMGFNLHLGRIFVDSQFLDNCDLAPTGKVYSACWVQSWKWVGPDGTEREFYHEDFLKIPQPVDEGVTRDDPPFHPIFTQRRTTDLSYALISGPGDEYCVDAGATSCFKVETPDGLVYTLSQRMACPDPSISQNVNYLKDARLRSMYQSYCGWYTTRIEDRSVTDDTPGHLHYPVFVSVAYNNMPAYEHVISSISDSTGRVTSFDSCQWQSEPSTPPTGPPGDDIRCASPETSVTNPNDPYQINSKIHAVALTAIHFPSFGNNILSTTDKAIYRFVYELSRVKRANKDLEDCQCPDGVNAPFCTENGICNTFLKNDAVLKLVRLDYPPYQKPGGSLDRYSMYFGYFDNQGTTGFDYGELACRTLPLGRVINGQEEVQGNPCDLDDQAGPARFRYHYDYYNYTESYLSGGRAPRKVPCPPPAASCNCAIDGVEQIPAGSFCGGTPGGGGGVFLTPKGYSRQVVTKTLLPTPAGQSPTRWSYERAPNTYLSNPPKVRVTDPFGNDTVYWFHASAPGRDVGNGAGLQDGYAPEWNDGMSYRTDYFEGPANTGRLVRSELQNYDADRDSLDPTLHKKTNVRVQQMTTQHMDDGGRSSVVTRNNWDKHGHWKSEAESGFEVATPRVTYREYQPFVSGVYRNDLLLYEEVTDGTRVLSRTDNRFDALGRLERSIARVTPLGAPGTGQNLTPQPGDVTTDFTYSNSSGNILTKTLKTGVSTDHGYAMRYTYAPAWPHCPAGHTSECGGYLATKQFLDPSAPPGTAAPAFPWLAIERSRDFNTGLIMWNKDTGGYQVNYEYDTLGRLTAIRPDQEEATEVNYQSLLETTVTQGSTGGASPSFVFTRYRYDELGRLVATQKRPADSTRYACQKTTYDVANRVTFQSEWRFIGSAGTPPENTCIPGQVEGATVCSVSGKDCTVSCTTDEGTCVVAGTTFDFHDPSTGAIDPFGRVRRVIPIDSGSGENDKSTTNEYFGNSTRIITKGLRGQGQSVFATMTVFNRDGFNRLIYVDSPSGTVCSLSGRPCASGGVCPANTGSCVSVNGGASATYTYDITDSLLQVDLSDGPLNTQTRRFAYDGLKRIKQAQNPENGTVVYGDYDALGNLLWLQDASGHRQKFAFDNAGRQLQQSIVPTGGGAEKVVNTNTYDEGRGQYAAGKVTTITSKDEVQALQLTERRFYDPAARGRVSKTEHQFADWGSLIQTTGYLYDSRGQLAELSYPAETPVTHTPLTVIYGYSNGQVVSATEKGYGLIATAEIGHVTYNAAGSVTTVSTPGGGLTTIGYDSRNRPRGITGGILAGTPPKWTYESGTYLYDGAGNIYGMDANRYAYDAASRLIVADTSYQGNSYHEAITYDAFGNQVQRLQSANGIDETDAYTFPASNTNRIATRSTTTGIGAPSAVNFYYDPNGNVIEAGRRWYVGQSIVEDIKRFDYGVLNRLQRVHRLGFLPTGSDLSEIDRFAYDSSGNRIWKVRSAGGPAVKTFYVRDLQGQVLSEFRAPTNGTGTVEWSSDTIYLAGRLLALKENLRPEPPSGLYGVQSANASPPGTWHVRLFWRENTEPDRAGYSIYRSQGTPNAWSLIGPPINATMFDDPTNLAAGVTYYYRVTCLDEAGNESLGSGTIKIVAGDVTGPTKPTLSGTAGDRRVVLTWSPSSDASGVAGYEITRRTSPYVEAPPITSQLVTETTYTDLNLTNGTTYYYLVRAKDNAGNWGPFSCKQGPAGAPCDLTATPKDYTPPVPPMAVKAASECGPPGAAEKITVSWDPNPDTDAVASYEIYRNTTPDFASLSPLATRPASALSYTDTTLTVGVTYYYALRAVDSSVPANRSVFSLPAPARTRDHTKTPTVRLGALVKDGVVELKWTKPASDPAPSEYLVYRKLNTEASCGSYVQVGSVFPPENPLPGATWTFSNGGVPNQMAYDYAVTARVSGVESSFSRPVLAIPVARVSNFYQCKGTAYPGCAGRGATEVYWNPPLEPRPYQPIFATPTEGSLGYLKGYHLYHHRVCLQGINNWYDDSPMTEVEIDPADPVDRYLVKDDANFTCNRYRVPDGRYWITSSTSLKPVVPPEVTTDRDPFLDCLGVGGAGGSNTHLNCVLPKAVYKVYAEGTWLTVESDWPDYWDSEKGNPEERCGRPLLENPPDCISETHRPLPPTSVNAAANGLDTIRVTWTPATQPAGVQIEGYYLYARRYQGTPLKFDYLHPLPFRRVSPDRTYEDVSGLMGPGIATNYMFGVAAFDSQGRMSTVREIDFPKSVAGNVTPSTKIILWTVNDDIHPADRSRRGIKLAWSKDTVPSGFARVGYRVYRSASFSFETYCALLNAGVNPPNVTACVNDTNGTIGDPNAASPTLTTDCAADSAPSCANMKYYWDRTVAPNRIYYYRVTEIQRNVSTEVLQETSLANTNSVSGKELPYEAAVLPPPTGFRAWAPWLAAEKSGVYLKWCDYPASTDLASLLSDYNYRIYRSKQPGGPYEYLATVDPLCLQNNQRCAITTVGSTAVLHPTACNETTEICEVTDQSFATGCGVNGCGGDYPCQYDPTPQFARYYYVVTGVGASGEESMASAENGAWLNYRLATTPACSVGWLPRRDPDGNGDTLMCGYENARMMLNEEAAPSTAESKVSLVIIEHGDEHLTAPHRTIGQLPNPYSPPARFVFYHLDHLGSPRVVLDRTTPVAIVLEQHHYLPFGDERPVTVPNTINTRAFTGHERDSENGLDYMMARYYSSSLGRFMAVDPGNDTQLENPQSWNKYTYVENNPLKYLDPNGRFKVVGSHRHQNISRAAPVQPNGVSGRDVVQGNRRADTVRIFGGGDLSAHINTGGGATGSASDTRVQSGTAQLGTAIRESAGGNTEAAGEALGGSHHSFQDLVGHGGASVDQHYSDANGGNMDSSSSPGFDTRYDAAVGLTSQINSIFNQATAAIAGGMPVDEAVATAQSEAETAAQASYSSTKETLKKNNQSPEGY